MNPFYKKFLPIRKITMKVKVLRFIRRKLIFIGISVDVLDTVKSVKDDENA